MEIARPQPNDLTLLHAKTLSTVGTECHGEAFVFAENAFVNVHNQKMLEPINDKICVVPV